MKPVEVEEFVGECSLATEVDYDLIDSKFDEGLAAVRELVDLMYFDYMEI